MYCCGSPQVIRANKNPLNTDKKHSLISLFFKQTFTREEAFVLTNIYLSSVNQYVYYIPLPVSGSGSSESSEESPTDLVISFESTLLTVSGGFSAHAVIAN